MEQQATAPEVYPRLVRRFQGVFIDGFVVPLCAMGTLVALTYAGVESTWVKVLCPLLVVFTLDPIAVSATGGSVGHHLVGLRVRKARADERIGIVAAVVRFVVKAVFGVPAFFVAFLNRRRQGLHDLAAGSLIVHKSTEGLPAYELLPARTSEDEHVAYVSVARRILVIVLYWVLLYVAASLVIAAITWGPCIDSGRQCTPTQAYAAMSVSLLLLASAVAVAVLGWLGRLYGCRKRPSVAAG
jgi:uncharacterized RDD family membrane protein YckC